MSQLPPDVLIKAYLAGELDAEAAERVRAYLEATPGRRGVMAGIWAAILGEDVAAVPRDIESSVKRLWTRIHHEQRESSALTGGARPRPGTGGIFPVWIWTVASLSAAVLLAITTLVVIPRRRGSDAGAVLTYVTARGERAKIVLPDGTHITLNVASRIDVPRTFGERNRSVHLAGEAYFAVAHATGAPFTVDAGGARTTVLGTEFGVQAYHPGDVQVAVQSGKVSVNHVVLTEQDVGRVSSGGAVRVAHHQSLDAALAFTTGQLVIADRPLREAIEALDRWYDVDIRLGDPALGDMRFDAVLVSGSIGDVMEVLRNTLDVRVARRGRTLTLYPQ